MLQFKEGRPTHTFTDVRHHLMLQLLADLFTRNDDGTHGEKRVFEEGEARRVGHHALGRDVCPQVHTARDA